MTERISVLMVSAEAHPLAKVGGLADVLGALPKALVALGHDVRIALPYYKMIKDRKVAAEKIPGVGAFEVDIGGTKRRAAVKVTELPGSQVQVLLIENDDFFGRPGIYTDPKTCKDYPDNPERFIFFSKAVLRLVGLMKWNPAIIHCHDYQAGFIPAWIATSAAVAEASRNAGSVFTIHNLAYQGVYPKAVALMAGFSEDLVKPMGPIEFYGNANMMKAGVVFADTITTVSPTYAREIQTPELGYGLDGVLRSRSRDVVGILNGADYDVWNPATDRLLPENYSSTNLEGKEKCKAALIKRLGLKLGGRGPLAGIVSRLVDQKGLDITMEALDAIVGLGVGLVVLGTGEKKYQDALLAGAKRFPGRLGVTIGFDEEMAHLIEAGCDMFLMPSKYEPCGLNQMYSMKYGTIPIVRKTGGLADSVQDVDETEDSTGFVFSEYTSRALIVAVERARRLYSKRELWRSMVLRAMARDFSWQRSAGAYRDLYSAMLDRKRAVSRS